MEETVDLVEYEGYTNLVPCYQYHRYPYLWPDGSPDSELSKDMVYNKYRCGEKFWPEMRKILQHEIEKQPMQLFRSWASTLCIPLHNNLRYHEPILTSLNAGDIVKESWIGVPDINKKHLQVFSDVDISWPTCQNLYHLVTQEIYQDMPKLGSIVELGGGYGDMALLIRRLGFKGKYTIFDFPEIHTFQKYFLDKNLCHAVYATEVNQLEPAELVIAAWSLSEMPFDLRDQLMKQLKGSKRWLVVHDDIIFDKDEGAWFVEAFKDFEATEVTRNFYIAAKSKCVLYTRKD